MGKMLPPNASLQLRRWRASRASRLSVGDGCVNRAQVRDAPAASAARLC